MVSYSGNLSVEAADFHVAHRPQVKLGFLSEWWCPLAHTGQETDDSQNEQPSSLASWASVLPE